jgi:hypothetical protein
VNILQDNIEQEQLGVCCDDVEQEQSVLVYDYEDELAGLESNETSFRVHYEIVPSTVSCSCRTYSIHVFNGIAYFLSTPINIYDSDLQKLNEE